jgi:hypothetical protein
LLSYVTRSRHDQEIVRNLTMRYLWRGEQSLMYKEFRWVRLLACPLGMPQFIKSSYIFSHSSKNQ